MTTFNDWLQEPEEQEQTEQIDENIDYNLMNEVRGKVSAPILKAMDKLMEAALKDGMALAADIKKAKLKHDKKRWAAIPEAKKLDKRAKLKNEELTVILDGYYDQNQKDSSFNTNVYPAPKFFQGENK